MKFGDAPWERLKLLQVANEVGLWDKGEVSPYVALHNIASMLNVPVKPYKQEPKRQRRRPTRKSAAQILAEQYMDDTRRVNTLTGFITRPLTKHNKLTRTPRRPKGKARP